MVVDLLVDWLNVLRWGLGGGVWLVCELLWFGCVATVGHLRSCGVYIGLLQLGCGCIGGLVLVGC